MWYLKRNPNCYYGKDNAKFWKSETGVGFYWERYVAKMIGGTHLEFNKNGSDIDWNGKLVDVKTSSLYHRKNKRGKPVIGEQKGVWGFKRGKAKSDFFFFVCLLDGKPFKFYLVPDSYFPKSGTVIGWESAYDKFLYPSHIIFS